MRAGDGVRTVAVVGAALCGSAVAVALDAGVETLLRGLVLGVMLGAGLALVVEGRRP